MMKIRQAQGLAQNGRRRIFILTTMKALTNGLSEVMLKIRQAQGLAQNGGRRIFILILKSCKLYKSC
ncbi:MAG TPA: hypothetical protein VHY08_21030 [Bacillota bacterium]|nr:hypothetical protein [Bacillota bacterium]